MKTLNFTITSLSPMLMSADDIEWADQLNAFIKSAGKKATTAGDDRTPAWKWLGSIYNDGKQVVIPTANLIRCLANAAANFQKKGMKTHKQDMVTALAFEADAFPLLVNAKPVPWEPIAALRDETDFAKHKARAAELGFAADVRRAVPNGKRHIRVRARFDHWSFKGSCHLLDDSLLKDGMLGQIFDHAGMTQGLGNYRPGLKSPGTFGRFKVSLDAA